VLSSLRLAKEIDSLHPRVLNTRRGFRDGESWSGVIQLEFPNMCFGRGGEDIQANARRGHGGKAVNSPVSDRVTPGEFFPAFSVPSLNKVMLNVLTIVQPFHRQAVIEGHRLGKINLEKSMM
jgi:hypothetical protein